MLQGAACKKKLFGGLLGIGHALHCFYYRLLYSLWRLWVDCFKFVRILVVVLLSKAVILFVCSLVYLLELLLIPVFYRPAAAHDHAVAVKMKPACCRSRVAVAPCQQPDKDACCKTSCCLNCPLANAATINDATGTDSKLRAVKRVYPHYVTTYHYTFYAVAWKPPASYS